MTLKAGDRIELVSMPNDPDPIPFGTRGTVTWNGGWVRGITARDYEQISVKWDNGRTLGLCIPPDVVRVVNDPLGLKRCASCGNAFEYDQLPDGTCRQCGGSFD